MGNNKDNKGVDMVGPPRPENREYHSDTKVVRFPVPANTSIVENRGSHTLVKFEGDVSISVINGDVYLVSVLR